MRTYHTNCNMNLRQKHRKHIHEKVLTGHSEGCGDEEEPHLVIMDMVNFQISEEQSEVFFF